MQERILYFDVIGGISGDMTLSSLLDLGVPVEIFLQELNKLNIQNEFKLEVSDKIENGIKGTKVEVITKEQHSHRNLTDIYNIIDNSELNDRIKLRAKKIFMEVAEAESNVHSTTIDKIHFHEVGAIDSIVDIVGSCILLDLLCIDKIYSTSIPLGSGFIKCAHGIIPAAAPATVEILKNVPVRLNHVNGECTTPTGAAIIKTVCDEFKDNVNLKIDKVGYGVGHKKFDKPNLLRVILCENVKSDEVYEISTNIDDMSSEVFSYLFEQILDEGALDIYIENIYMKKNRPAYKICVLSEEKDLDKFIKILLMETSSFGVRYNRFFRKKIDRKFVDIETEFGIVKIKLGYYDGELIKAKPEYEQCKEISLKFDLPLIQIYDAINTNINNKINEKLLT